MKKIVFTSFALFLLGCSGSRFPDKERNLEDFIPIEEVPTEISTNPEDFHFGEEYFPDQCEWRTLVRVIDGDTIEIDGGEHVRFIGIDTPEIKDPDKPVQKGGLEASRKTKEFLSSSEKVCLISDSIGDEYDQYNRKLAYIFTEQGVDVNAELLKGGFARGYLYFPFNRKEEFRFLSEQAKKAKLGVWGN